MKNCLVNQVTLRKIKIARGIQHDFEVPEWNQYCLANKKFIEVKETQQKPLLPDKESKDFITKKR